MIIIHSNNNNNSFIYWESNLEPSAYIHKNRKNGRDSNYLILLRRSNIESVPRKSSTINVSKVMRKKTLIKIVDYRKTSFLKNK